MNKKIPVILSSLAALSYSGVISAATNLYNDGTYSSNGSYYSPEGLENVSLSIKLLGGKITDTTFTATSNNRTSQYYDNLFISGFKSSVIGKNIDEVNLTVINGSSLTPKGFNDALSKIKQQALVKSNTQTTPITSSVSNKSTNTNNKPAISPDKQKKIDSIKKIQDKKIAEIDKQIKVLQDKKAKLIKEYQANYKKISGQDLIVSSEKNNKEIEKEIED